MSDFIHKSHEEIVEGMLMEFAKELGVEKVLGASDIAIKTKVLAAQIEGIYYNQQYVLNQAFPQTATGENLKKHGYKHDVEIKPARESIGKVIMGRKTPSNQDILIPSGNPFSTNPNIYGNLVEGVTTEDVILKSGQLEIEISAKTITFGKKGNVSPGSFIVLNAPVPGIEFVRNDTDFINGADEEDEEEYRKRILDKTRRPGTSGNPSHYRQWALEAPGVGSAKVFRTWGGKNTVKVVICDSDMRTASQSLIDDVYNHIDNEKPVGAIPTVISAIENVVNISASITAANGYTVQEILVSFKQKIIEYFKSIAFKDSYVSYAKIGGILLDIEGVGDYSDLKLNIGNGNILLGEEDIPVLGTVTLELMI